MSAVATPSRSVGRAGGTPSPERTYAFVVGVERYDAGPAWDLDGPASDAARFTAWLLDRGVPADQVLVFLARLDDRPLDPPLPPEIKVRPARHEPVYEALARTLPGWRGELLWLFWAGHGVLTLDESRRLFYADATIDDKRNLDLTSLLAALRTDTYAGFPRQVAVVDACQNYAERLQLAKTLPSETFAYGQPSPVRDQFVLYAASPGQAAVNRGRARAGVFSEELLRELVGTPEDVWPPDMDAIAVRLWERFLTLSKDGRADQTPISFGYRTWSGKERVLSETPPEPAGVAAAATSRPPSGVAFPSGQSERDNASRPRRFSGRRIVTVPAYFKGRVDEQRDLCRYFGDPRTRMVSIVGHSGFGKTTLACKVLEEAELSGQLGAETPIHVDGIVYMGAHSDGISVEKVLDNCADLLGGEEVDNIRGSERSTEWKVEELNSKLARGFYIILLDDLDDRLDSSGDLGDSDLREFIRQTLAFPHAARLLVTSQQPLRLDAAAASVTRTIPLEGLSAADGVAMLREVGRDDGLKRVPKPKLVDAVGKLGGSPKALEEFASAFWKYWQRGERNVTRILQTALEGNVVKWIDTQLYDGLGDLEWEVLYALATFGRPVPLDALRFVLEDTETSRVEEAVDHLNRTLIIKPVERGLTLSASDLSRVCDRLLHESEASRRTLQLCAARYYGSIRLPMKENWHRLADVQPRLLEVDHRIKAGDYDTAARVLSEVDIDFLIWGGYEKQALQRREQLTGKIHDDQLRIEHLLALANIRALLGPTALAVQYAEEAGHLADQLGDRGMKCRSLFILGEANRRHGSMTDAIKSLQQAVDDCPKDLTLHDGTHLALSLAYTYTGKYAQAVSTARNLLDLAKQHADPRRCADAYDALSLAYVAVGDFDGALRSVELAIDALGRPPDSGGVGYLLNVRGLALANQHATEKAIAAFKKGRVLGHRYNDPRIEAFCLFNLARVYWASGSVEPALEASEQALEIFTDIAAWEAKIALAFVQAIHARQVGDRAAEARALLSCAQDSSRVADLLSPMDLLDEVKGIAASERLSDIQQQAQVLAAELRRRVAAGH